MGIAEHTHKQARSPNVDHINTHPHTFSKSPFSALQLERESRCLIHPPFTVKTIHSAACSLFNSEPQKWCHPRGMFLRVCFWVDIKNTMDTYWVCGLLFQGNQNTLTQTAKINMNVTKGIIWYFLEITCRGNMWYLIISKYHNLQNTKLLQSNTILMQCSWKSYFQLLSYSQAVFN